MSLRQDIGILPIVLEKLYMKVHDKVAFPIQLGTAPFCLERSQSKVLINILCEEFYTLGHGGIYM